MSRCIICIAVFFSMLSCEKEQPLETDPAKIILGKWKPIEIGNWPNMEPYNGTIYWEFCDSNVMKFFDSESEAYIKTPEYEIQDSLLTIIHYLNDDTLRFRYKIKFIDENNKFKLDLTHSIFNTYIYERTKF